MLTYSQLRLTWPRLRKALKSSSNSFPVKAVQTPTVGAVDLFFCASEGWERDWTDQSLPEEFHGVLARMGEALHDTVQSPAVAKNFDCLPEQLLEEVRNLRI